MTHLWNCKGTYSGIASAYRPASQMRKNYKTTRPSTHRRPTNFQQCSEHVVFLPIWLRNLLRATMACTFLIIWMSKSTARLRCFFTILTSKCVSRSNGVQFLISHLPKRLHTCRFSEYTFRPSGPTRHWKKRLFYLFARLHLLSADSFSSLIFFLLLFSSLTALTPIASSVPIFESLTSKLTSAKLAQSTSQYYFVLLLQKLHKTLPSTSLHYKACTKHFPVILCNTKLAQSTSQYYCVLQSLHKVLPSTTFFYCARHSGLLVLQNLHEVLAGTICTTKVAQTLPSTTPKSVQSTLYYKACKMYFPVCTAKIAQSTSQYCLYYKLAQNTQNTAPYYFVHQSLHESLPGITLHCKACAKYSYTQQAFEHRSFHVHSGSRNCCSKTRFRRQSEKGTGRFWSTVSN